MKKQNILGNLHDFLSYVSDVAEQCNCQAIEEVIMFAGTEPPDYFPAIIDPITLIGSASLSLYPCNDLPMDDCPVGWINMWLTHQGLVYRYCAYEKPTDSDSMFTPVLWDFRETQFDFQIGSIPVPSPEYVASRATAMMSEYFPTNPSLVS